MEHVVKPRGLKVVDAVGIVFLRTSYWRFTRTI